MENQDFSQETNENMQVPVLSVKDWLITLVITAIPIVGLIFLFLWAFGSDTNPNKANWAKAALLFYVILFVLYAVSMVFFFGAFAMLGNGSM